MQGMRVADAMLTCPKTHRADCSLEAVRGFFAEDHVHMALIVAEDGRLLTTIERPDMAAGTSSSPPVTKLGKLAGRITRPAEPLASATALLRAEGRRRLAVVDHDGRLIGLLCLKKDGSGYCSNEGVQARARERQTSHAARHLR